MREGKQPAFRAGTALAAGRRVKITGAAAGYYDGHTVGYADADDANAIGVTLGDAGADEPVTVNLFNEPVAANCSGDIDLGAEAFASADGQVTGAGSVSVGVALDAGSAGRSILIVPR